MGAAYEGEWVMSSILDDRAERIGDRAAVIEPEGRTVTWAALRERTQRIAALLGQLGVEPGARVATMMDPTAAHVETALGCAWAGAIEVPVNTDWKGLYLQHLLEETGAVVLVVQDRFVPRLAGLDVPALAHVVVVGDDPVETSAGVAVHRLTDADALDGAPRVRRDEKDLSIILYTSGTTGASKGATHCNRSALWTARVWRDLVGLTDEDVGYSYLPMFHVTARTAMFTGCMISGGTTVLRERFSLSSFWDDVRRFGATYTMYMGAVIHLLHSQEPRPDDLDNPLRAAGGAAAPPGIGEEFKQRFGCELYEVFGMTEIGTATAGRMGHGTPGSMGKPFPHLDIEIHGPDDAPLPPETPGELVVRPNEPYAIFQGYWRRPEETLEAFRNLWFHTGDMGRMTELGEVVYMDRLKDSMRRRGENISSFEVERSVNAHPAVLESAAFGVPSELTEDEVMVAIVARPGASLDEAEVLRFCAETMPRFAVPRYVRVVAALPKTPTGRVQKHVLRDEGITRDTVDREVLGIVVARS